MSLMFTAVMRLHKKTFVSFGAYVALFPQLVAGPIVRYTTIADQLDNRRESTDMFAYGIKRFVTGLAKRFYWPTPLVRFGRSFQPWKFLA